MRRVRKLPRPHLLLPRHRIRQSVHHLRDRLGVPPGRGFCEDDSVVVFRGFSDAATREVIGLRRSVGAALTSGATWLGSLLGNHGGFSSSAEKFVGLFAAACLFLCGVTERHSEVEAVLEVVEEQFFCSLTEKVLGHDESQLWGKVLGLGQHSRFVIAELRAA